MNKEKILKQVDKLYEMWQSGNLGGEFMPEDENPHLPKNSLENYLYFTLPMALNYQRNSYKLWESANQTYNDLETRFVFNPKEVVKKEFREVQDALTKYKVALQKNKQTEIWIKLCQTFVDLYDGDIRKLFSKLNYDVNLIRNFIQKDNKNLFPYLSGMKICNYWMYVLWQYTDLEFQNLADLTVAPDTHVIKSTHRLGLINNEELESNNVQMIVIKKWNELLKGTKYKPIDIHTSLWLWSRNNFKSLDSNNILENIFKSSLYVANNSQYVKINQLAIKKVIKKYKFITPKHWLSTNPFGILNLDIKDLVNFLVIFGTIDCSFWGEPKWTIQKEDQNIDGAFALIYALLNLRNKKGHLNFEKISFKEFQEVLKGNIDIPLIKERYEKVVNVSKIINTKMGGNFYNYIKDITSDRELFQIIIDNFPEFKDERTYKGQKIYFYKLAMLLTADILQIRFLKENILVDCSNLMACADYKIPQVLRGLGILEYTEELEKLIDNKIEIAENSVYEVEIRANMIIAIKYLKEELLNKLSVIEINDIIWNLGQNKSIDFLPYHRTRTMNY